jgi:hypothetical protein
MTEKDEADSEPKSLFQRDYTQIKLYWNRINSSIHLYAKHPTSSGKKTTAIMR